MTPLLVYVQDPSLADATKEAIALWNAAIGEEALRFVNKADGAGIVIKRGVLMQTERLQPLAAASPTMGGEAKGGEIQIPTDEQLKESYGQNYSIVHLLTHELGHTLGLAHPVRGEPNMGAMGYGSLGSGPSASEAGGARYIEQGGQVYPPSANVVEKNQGLQGGPPPGQHWMDLAQRFQVGGFESPFPAAALLVSAGLQARARRGADLGGYDEHQYLMDVSTMARTLRPNNSADAYESKQRVVRKTPSKKVAGGGGPSNQKRE